MKKILIIGGGVIGLMTARELSQAGAEVALIEMGSTGKESSWAGGGILSPLYPWRYRGAVTALASWSQRIYPEFCEALFEETGVDPEYNRSGLMILDPDAPDLALNWAETEQAPIEVLDRAALAEKEPGLNVDTDGALWMPEVAQIRNPRLTKALHASISKRVEMREREEVLDLQVEDGRVRGVTTTSGAIEAEHVIVCTGAWTAQLLEKLGRKPNIRPVRGQMILFYAKPGQIRHLSLYRERYVIPRKDGRVLIGSTLEEAGFEKRTTAEAKEELYRVATEMFPLLKRTPIEDHWAGLRPGSPSGIPYIAPYPGAEGLYVNAGHFRNGLVTGPASARLIADIVLERPPILPPSAYALDSPRT
ncbi:glycine oxidase ThiO [Lamprobacter modestohalophilus]|uniref:glycine oxidase ThiO n=1 Tax=Lamprobacter modestohalophilus TaxID=1064514 RepID=UPI002ADEADC9|nr:glycine oxidase ThiO [Lamprobacter modestohalophilus]MEA1053073.1 glycine oxidase ThiO [Lamprobacter modestohalophilus]